MSLKKPHILPFLLATVLLLGCGHHRYDGELALVDSLQKLDSAYLSDSLLQPIVRYYDRYGTRNQQARAHYLLGRTYHIEGLLPQALDAYQTAAERADTTARDRDYSLLMKVYACQSIVFQYQRLSEEALQSLAQEEYYARLVNDSLTITVCNLYRMLAFYDINQHDSLEIYGKKTYEGYCRMGLHSQAVLSQFTLLHSYLERKEFEPAKRLLDEIDHTYDYFNEKGDVLYESSTYYYCKGLYYLGVNQLDSAEYYFLKESEYSDDYNNQIGASRGLSLVYEQKGDYRKSTAYAQQAYSLNDSAYNLSVAENLQQMQAAYDYSRHLKEKEVYKEKAARERQNLYLLLVFVTIIFFASFSYYKKYRSAQQAEHARQLALYSNLRQMLEQSKRECHEKEKDHGHLISKVETLKAEISIRKKQIKMLEKRLHVGDDYFLKEKLDASLVYQYFKNYSASPLAADPPIASDWNRLRELYAEVLPGVKSFFDASTSLNSKERDVCMLTRMYFDNHEIILLLGEKTPSRLSTLRTRIHEKLYGKSGTPKELVSKIMQMK